MKKTAGWLWGIGVGATLASGPAWADKTKTEERAEKRIESRVDHDKRLKDDHIKVDVDSGVVTLKGNVDSESEKIHAERLAKIKGIGRVDNQLRVDQGETAGEVVADSWITTKVKAQFVGEDLLDGSNISVDTTDNTVTLS